MSISDESALHLALYYAPTCYAGTEKVGYKDIRAGAQREVDRLQEAISALRAEVETLRAENKQLSAMVQEDTLHMLMDAHEQLHLELAALATTRSQLAGARQALEEIAESTCLNVLRLGGDFVCTQYEDVDELCEVCIARAALSEGG
jgi:phosphoenolpyruvate-protein kinase (PTS system EI component)